MQQYKVFVDGAVGTTGLRIYQRLQNQPDIQLLILPDAERKETVYRLDAIAEADVTVLCLPDDAAKEIAALAPPSAKICDASTAHRTKPGWVYGFPELAARRSQLQSANRIAVPGCHATGFLALSAPLVEKGAVAATHIFACNSLTGYSGGGKAMIADYQSPARPATYQAPRMYGLGMAHKHLPEMQAIAQLAAAPLFTPVVGDYYSGMLVSVPLSTAHLNKAYPTGEAIAQLLADYYQNEPLITVHPFGTAPAMLAASGMAGLDTLEIFVTGNTQQILLCALFDNLGKGASGAAIQCLNLALGRNETKGLVLQPEKE